jgi:hypothetical protein
MIKIIPSTFISTILIWSLDYCTNVARRSTFVDFGRALPGSLRLKTRIRPRALQDLDHAPDKAWSFARSVSIA